MGLGRHVITVTVLRTRVLEIGAWCDHCLLPAAVAFEHLLRIGRGRLRYARGRWCTECEIGESEEIHLDE